MSLMKITYKGLFGAMGLLLALAACTGNDVPEALPEKENLSISWNVIPEGMQEGRSLINNNAALQNACTPSPDGGGQAIGIWSACRVKEDSLKNMLGVDGDASLIYQSGTDWHNHMGWTYGEKAAYWIHNAVYYFNAYFPKTGGMASIANDSTSLKGIFNTETTQTDLMLTRVRVDTHGDFKGLPVSLPMVHALATLKFVFLIEDGDATNFLKAFSLDKTLKTIGRLNYNTDAITIANWTATPSDTGVSRIYEWANGDGVSFTVTKEAVPYVTEGNKGGHLFIIPQSCATAPTFDCTIGVNATESLPFQNISLGTTLFEPGKNYIYTIKVKANVLDVELSIKDWNELDSSYNIDF